MADNKQRGKYIDLYVFPYENIIKGSRVVIYGAGYVGRRYVEQIIENNYCKIVCVVDKKVDELYSDKVALMHPKMLKALEFDYLVIAIKEEAEARRIKDDLVKEYDIWVGKIVWKKRMEYFYAPTKSIWNKLSGGSLCSEDVLICIRLGAGFGDVIISKKIIDTLGALAGPHCSIDIYVHDITCSFVRGLFRKCNYVKNIYSDSERNYSRYFQSYDLAIFPFYIMSIEYIDENNLIRKNPTFAERMVKLKSYLDKEGLNNRHQLDNAVLFARAKKRGCNAYTIHSYGGLLNIKDNKVDIPLLPEYENIYGTIQLNNQIYNYITINYGWGMNRHKKDVVPCKIWPIEYYTRLVTLIKNKYPDLKLVQIGRGNVPNIPGVDVFLFDLDIEVIKYILRDSIIHIDSEGGMVHLATQLGTKCLVPFGPTPVHFFGYESNLNVVAEPCSDCYFMDEDFVKCLRGLKKAECMYSITPDRMFGVFEKYIKDKGLVL